MREGTLIKAAVLFVVVLHEAGVSFTLPPMKLSRAIAVRNAWEDASWRADIVALEVNCRNVPIEVGDDSPVGREKVLPS